MDSIKVNDYIDAKVIEIRPKVGAIMETPEGLTGLLHISEISDLFVSNINDYFDIGDTLKVVVVEIDEKNNFMRLSLKKNKNSKKQIKNINNQKIINQSTDFTTLKENLERWIEKVEKEYD